jgi:hypothetical protein
VLRSTLQGLSKSRPWSPDIHRRGFDKEIIRERRIQSESCGRNRVPVLVRQNALREVTGIPTVSDALNTPVTIDSEPQILQAGSLLDPPAHDHEIRRMTITPVQNTFREAPEARLRLTISMAESRRKLPGQPVSGSCPGEVGGQNLGPMD